MAGHVLQLTLRTLDALAGLLPWARDKRAPHLRTGARGEEDAFFYLRRRGYVMVARNWRSPHRRSDLDLIGWDGPTLCFVEVKTRATREVAPAHVAVDEEKERQLRGLARDYLRRLSGRGLRSEPPHRFDIVSVYHDGPKACFELFQNAFSGVRR